MTDTAAIRANNRARLISFFHDGIKSPEMAGALGVEIEHFVTAEDGSPICYEPGEGRIGVRDVLEELAGVYPEQTRNHHGDLLGLAGDEGTVTLEPSAQLENSVAPYRSIADVARAYGHFRSCADGVLVRGHAKLGNGGYHPSRRAQDLTLIPKRRYDIMDSYFAHIHSHGDRMMRASASTQVSVDFLSEEDAVRKMRVASVLSPILAAIADGTTTFEAEPNHVPIRRLQLWREVDPLRCGTVPGVFDGGFGFEAYADWLLRTPPIFVTRPSAADPEGPRVREVFEDSAAVAYEDAPMSKKDVEHLISMFWPDVRLKHFVEVRPADSLDEASALGYTALVKGIFYDEGSLPAIEDLLGVDPGVAESRGAWPVSEGDVSEAIVQVQAHGWEGVLYGRTLQSWVETLFELARRALDKDEAAYLLPLETFAWDKTWWHTSAAR